MAGTRGTSRGAVEGHPRWPSLEEQLGAAHARPGSALDELIRRNQDVSILAGEEPAGASFPLWLRVHWRKAHPGSRGYPRTLHRVHAWYLMHPDDERLRRLVAARG